MASLFSLWNRGEIDVGLKEEIQCYGLPYGGFGFADHLLTYWAILCLSYQRSPWRPWRVIHHTHFDVGLGIGQLIPTVVLAIITITRCRDRWQFIAMGCWKLALSLTVGVFTIHAAHLAAHSPSKVEGEKQKRNPNSKRALWWTLLYIPGVAAGLTGLISLVVRTISDDNDIRVITYVFGGAVAAPMLLAALIVRNNSKKKERTAEEGQNQLSEKEENLIVLAAIITSLGLTVVLAALYSDWILAVIAESLVGKPSQKLQKTYYAYLVLKRLPLFSC